MEETLTNLCLTNCEFSMVQTKQIGQTRSTCYRLKEWDSLEGLVELFRKHTVLIHLWVKRIAAPGYLQTTDCIAVFRHYLWVKSRELWSDFTHSLLFTHAQHSGRFSSQTCSQQQQILHVIRARGGAVFFTRRYFLYFASLSCWIFINPPTPSLWFQGGSPAVFSHRIVPTFCWLRGQVEKVCR